MSAMADGSIRPIVERACREESRRVLATLIRLLGEFDLVEDALHDALGAALEQWPGDGVSANPRARLISTGRFKAVFQLRHPARPELTPEDLAKQLVAESSSDDKLGQQGIEDDGLRLIFACCHPARLSELPSGCIPSTHRAATSDR